MAKKPLHREAQQLLTDLLIPFYGIERDMHVKLDPNQPRHTENDAEHSWSLAVLACSLAPHIDTKLDIGLVCQFAVVHDLAEAYCGDVSVWADDSMLDSKEEREAASLEIIYKNFAHFEWLVNALKAYEAGDTDEARYVRAVDKYIALCTRFLDDGEYYHEIGLTKEKFNKKLIIHRKKAHLHAGVAEYYELIRAEYDAHPEHFPKKS
jgi:putative hydrolase of HD superfamily